MYFTFKALAGKVNLDKECVPNFALFEIMEYGFGKLNGNFTSRLLQVLILLALLCHDGELK